VDSRRKKYLRTFSHLSRITGSAMISENLYSLAGTITYSPLVNLVLMYSAMIRTVVNLG